MYSSIKLSTNRCSAEQSVLNKTINSIIWPGKWDCNWPKSTVNIQNHTVQMHLENIHGSLAILVARKSGFNRTLECRQGAFIRNWHWVQLSFRSFYNLFESKLNRDYQFSNWFLKNGFSTNQSAWFKHHFENFIWTKGL